MVKKPQVKTRKIIHLKTRYSKKSKVKLAKKIIHRAYSNAGRANSGVKLRAVHLQHLDSIKIFHKAMVMGR